MQTMQSVKHKPHELEKSITVAGSSSVKGSRQMLQASSQGSCTPPSTKAAADVKWVSVTFLFSSIPNTKTRDSQNILCNAIRGMETGSTRRPDAKWNAQTVSATFESTFESMAEIVAIV